MYACPACSAPLDPEGICTACGALSRGFFRGLDLGTPQIATAVAQGLDFYLLLGVSPDADIRAMARRYRQLRVLFPDDPSNLTDEAMQRLTLLEQAGRVLTDPQLRRGYDDMRASTLIEIAHEVLRCPSCAAPFAPEAQHCAFCGTARPAAPQAPAAPPAAAGPPPSEPVDYYAMLGLNAEHLIAPPPSAGAGLSSSSALINLGRTTFTRPPTPEEVDLAALARERQLLLTPSFHPEERESRVGELEIARRILRDEQLRSRYDALLLHFRQGLMHGGRLDALHHLQKIVRAQFAEERGEAVTRTEGAALLKQGVGYINARLPSEAIAPLRQAIRALPQSPEAHAAYVTAVLTSADPLTLGGHALRQALGSLETLEELRTIDAHEAAQMALCRGLIARDNGQHQLAESELIRASNLDPQLSAAWRGLAALALGRRAYSEALEHCQHALTINPQDEPALLLAIGACLHSKQPELAYAFASQVATLRGSGATARSVLQEMGG